MAITGNGSKLAHATTSGGTFTNFHESVKIGSPKPSGEKIDTTSLDSVAYKDFIMGLLSAGAVDVEANYNDADYVLLLAMVGVKTFFKHTLPNGAIYTYAGYVQEPAFETTNEKITTKYKIEIPGAPVYTAGS